MSLSTIEQCAFADDPNSKFEHPADQKTICSQESDKVKQYISDVCPSSSQSDALSSFQSACKAANLGKHFQSNIDCSAFADRI